MSKPTYSQNLQRLNLQPQQVMVEPTKCLREQTYSLTLSRLSMSEGDKPTAKPCYGWQSMPTEYKTYIHILLRLPMTEIDKHAAKAIYVGVIVPQPNPSC